MDYEQLKMAVWRLLYFVRITHPGITQFDCPYMQDLAERTRFWEDFSERELFSHEFDN